MLEDQFSSLILPLASGCPWPLAESLTRQAAIEFFKKSLCWRDLLEFDATDENTTVYTLSPPEGAVIEKLLLAWVGGQQVTLATIEAGELDQIAGNFNGLIWTRNRKTITLNNPQAAGTKVQLSAALKPSQAATQVDPDQFEQHADAIVHGALARILAIADKKWTDKPEAMRHAGLFEEAIGDAQAAAQAAFARTGQTTTPRYF